MMLSKLFGDRKFYSSLLLIAVPIAIQQLISSSLNMMDVLMIGQLGEASIAAMGLANQIFFLLNVITFGITSGSAIFTAQYWGKRDLPNIHRILGICLSIAISVAALFTVAAVFFPRNVLSVYTRDPEVIALGSQYLRIVGLSYIMTAITFSFVAVLRSTGEVRLPMIVSGSALTFKTLLNFLLIFGNFGFPALGVRGAAYGTLIARTLEFGVLIFMAYRLKLPAAARIRAMFSFDLPFFMRTLKTALPAALNELFWSLGITTYNAIYAHISTESIAAINITSTVEDLAFVVFIGLANGGAIMIGNRIGAGQEEEAVEYGQRFLRLAVSLAVLVGMGVLLLRDPILSLYKITPESRYYAHTILTVLGFLLWIKASNLTLFIGVLRSGGDTRFALLLESGTLWLIGVPAAIIATSIFHLPVYWVYLIVYSEEITKLIFVYRRYRSKAWVHNLVSV